MGGKREKKFDMEGNNGLMGRTKDILDGWTGLHGYNIQQGHDEGGGVPIPQCWVTLSPWEVKGYKPPVCQLNKKFLYIDAIFGWLHSNLRI